MSNEAQTVLPDVQYGTQFIFRPQAGYQTLYDGANARRLLYLFPAVPGESVVQTVDPLAAEKIPGYAENLARGLSVPMGSRVLVWLPSPFYDDPLDSNRRKGYEYVLIWRLRNLFDYRTNRRPYHIPSTTGQRDSVTNQTLVPIPAAVECITYGQNEPAGSLLNPAQANVHPLSLEAGGSPFLGPLVEAPSTFGPVQQGILDPAVSGAPIAEATGFVTFETTAKGDELLIGVRRSGGGAQWNFAEGEIDEFFPLYLRDDYQYSGVFVFTGAASAFSTANLASNGTPTT